MPGALKQWPAWPEFTEGKSEPDPTGELIQYKKEIIAIYGEAAIRSSWLKVCKELEKVTDDISEKGTAAIPEVSYTELFELSPERKQVLKDTGCFVVRGVVSESLASEWFDNLKAYVADNKPNIGGWPSETPFVLRLYWSPTQLAARSHPHQLRLQRELNSWWHDSPTNPTMSPEPLSYADAVRIRPPGVPFFGLGPHVDAGSLCRWADPSYRKVYDHIFSGEPEKHDCYDLETRKDAKQAHFRGGAHSTVLRAFQGWTALTSAGKQEGSLLLYPNVKTAIAYMLLRPFFTAPASEKEIMDASKWTLDTDNGWFPGTWKQDSQRASPTSHPHLRLKECMVNIPAMRPGDGIFWHTDMLHAVETDHLGKHDSSVAYIAATPTTEANNAYMKRQAAAFMNGGKVPEDFTPGNVDHEGEFKGYVGEAGILNGEAGRRAAGIVGL
ncbi:Uncharacterized protein LSUE1_G000846 [Lachnellula suecica]|uniref:DUF1479-domain-containing protein n=1 Tax=Lachnellula suecica TaxID=602035 RepID=A0A8T9CHN5_9HELO|nr:Uncharacterized protein LSUE1_G000846 [Lachnellula suecica]